MAFEEQNFNDEPYIGSTNVTVLSWTGNPPVYNSGGIPQYSVVTQDTGTGNVGDVIVATSTTVMPIGISQDGPAIGPGNSVRVRTDGISKAIAGAAISVDALLMVNGSGQVVTATAAGASNFFTIGKALTAATQAGDIVSVRLRIGSSQYVAS